MAVFLTILKIIGIVLAAILGLVILLLLLILIVPIRYKLHGVRDSECKIVNEEGNEKIPTRGKASISWLLHIIHGEVLYDEGINVIIRIFGIPLYNMQRKKEKVVSENARSKKSKTEGVKTTKKGKKKDFLTEEEIEGNTSSDETVTEAYEAGFDASVDELDEKCDKKKKRKLSFKERWNSVTAAFEKIPSQFEDLRKNTVDKIASILETVQYYYKLLHTKGAYNVYDFVKAELKKIFGHIKPRSIKGLIDYSSDDPAKSAGMCRNYGYALMILPRDLKMNIGYGDAHLYFDATVKGHITIGYLGLQGLKVIFNKRLKIFLKKLKREGA